MVRRSVEPIPDAGLAIVTAVWLGMLVGVSFLATPVKFQAPSLDLGVALEVGRVTFAAFTKVEWVLCLLLSALVLWHRSTRGEMLLAGAAVLIVVVQALWLLPALDARVEAVILGRPMPPSVHHMLYAGLEAGKALVLGWIAGIALFRLGWQNTPRSVVETP